MTSFSSLSDRMSLTGHRNGRLSVIVKGRAITGVPHHCTRDVLLLTSVNVVFSYPFLMAFPPQWLSMTATETDFWHSQAVRLWEAIRAADDGICWPMVCRRHCMYGSRRAVPQSQTDSDFCYSLSIAANGFLKKVFSALSLTVWQQRIADMLICKQSQRKVQTLPNRLLNSVLWGVKYLDVSHKSFLFFSSHNCWPISHISVISTIKSLFVFIVFIIIALNIQLTPMCWMRSLCLSFLLIQWRFVWLAIHMNTNRQTESTVCRRDLPLL